MRSTFTFCGTVPSKKNCKKIITVRGRPCIVSSDEYLAWEKAELKKLANAPKLFPPYSVEMIAYPADLRSCDHSNKFESIADLLVLAGILEDDNWFALSGVRLQFGVVDIVNPRIEVTIESCDHENSIEQIKAPLKVAIDRQRRLLKKSKANATTSLTRRSPPGERGLGGANP